MSRLTEVGESHVLGDLTYLANDLAIDLPPAKKMSPCKFAGCYGRTSAAVELAAGGGVRPDTWELCGTAARYLPTASSMRSSVARVWFFHEGRDIAPPVEHAPHVDVVLPLDVEDYVREARQRPAKKSRYLQLGGVPGRANGGMLAQNEESVFERVDEGERSLLRVLFEVRTRWRPRRPGWPGCGGRQAWDSLADAVTQCGEV